MQPADLAAAGLPEPAPAPTTASASAGRSDAASPTLLATPSPEPLPAPAPAESKPIVENAKADRDSNKLPQSLDPPASVTLASSSTPQEKAAAATASPSPPASSPESLPLATKLETGNNQPNSAAGPPPSDPPLPETVKAAAAASALTPSAEPPGKSEKPDSKVIAQNEASAKLEPPAAAKSSETGQPGLPALPIPITVASEPGKVEPNRPEPPQSAPQKIQELAPAPTPGPGAGASAIEPANGSVAAAPANLPAPASQPIESPKAPAELPLPSPEITAPGTLSAPSQAVPVPVPPPAQKAPAEPSSTGPPASPVKSKESSDSQSIAPPTNSKPADNPPRDLKNESQGTIVSTPISQLETPRDDDRRHTASNKPAATTTTRDSLGDGWVVVPNSGKLPLDDTEAAASETGSGSRGDQGDIKSRDFRSHAAKDVQFELESPRSRATSGLERAGAATAAAVTGAALEAGSNNTAERVEPVPHVVESKENFWTISRLYYSSGRYYRALWKANEGTHPNIKSLRVGDVIIIPPVEDLDPSLIDPPRRGSSLADSSGGPRRSSVNGGSSTSRNEADSFAIESDSTPASRRDDGLTASCANPAMAAAEGVPVRRSIRTDPDLDLPPPERVARRGTRPDDHSGRVVDRSLSEDDSIAEEPAARTVTRTRAADSTSGKRSVYKIRSYDTLRSIARDMLGDSHRASEILDLNRDLIDDPSHLIVGQVIELPDDARPSLRRSASR